MTLNEAIHRMMTCVPLTGWCPRENECFLVANTLRDYRKACGSVFDSEPEPEPDWLWMNSTEDQTDDEDEEDLIVEVYAPEVGFFLQQKPDFDFEYD